MPFSCFSIVSSVVRSRVREHFSALFQATSAFSAYSSLFHPSGFFPFLLLLLFWCFVFVSVCKIFGAALHSVPRLALNFQSSHTSSWVQNCRHSPLCPRLCFLCNEYLSFNWYFSLSVLLTLFEDLSLFHLSPWVSQWHDPSSLFPQLSWGINCIQHTLDCGNFLDRGWFPEDLVEQSNHKPLDTGASIPPFSSTMAEQTVVNCNQTMWLMWSQGFIHWASDEIHFWSGLHAWALPTCQTDSGLLWSEHELWTSGSCVCVERMLFRMTMLILEHPIFETCVFLSQEQQEIPFWILLRECCEESFPCSLPDCPLWGEHPPPQAPTAVFCLTTGPALMEPKTMDRNLLDHEPKYPFLCLAFMSGICHSKEKSQYNAASVSLSHCRLLWGAISPAWDDA